MTQYIRISKSATGLCIVPPHKQIAAHWFIHSDCSQQPYNVGVSELSHESCFLEECSLAFVCGSFFQHLDGNLLRAIWSDPGPFEHFTKLT